MKKTIVLIQFLFLTSSLFAETEKRDIAFAQIWDLVKKNSPSIGAANFDLKAARVAEDRAGSHWYPRLYVDARAFETNDPALSFVSVLEERRIGTSDFYPQALNQPMDNLYEQGTLGLDLPLFEGGAKVSMADSARRSRQARELEMETATTGQYAQLASAYASLMALREEQLDLDKLKAKVGEMIKGYSIGSRSNPVGYSGLLGLKNLDNRLSGLRARNQAQWNSLIGQVDIQTRSLTDDWAPTEGNPRNFLEQVFPLFGKPQDPSFVLAAQAGADSLEKLRGVETARLFPKVGLFGQGSLNGGDRSTTTSYMAGAYLQWDLLDIPNLGAGEQANDSWEAAKARAEALRQKTNTEVVQAKESLQAIETNLGLMDESAKLLDEQTETAKSLFKNGSINALQLVEVLARRVDLIANRTQTQMDLIEARVTLAVDSGFKEPSHVAQ